MRNPKPHSTGPPVAHRAWTALSIVIGTLFVPAGLFAAFFAWEMNLPVEPLFILIVAGVGAGCLAWQGTLAALVATALMLLVMDGHPFPERWTVIGETCGAIAAAALATGVAVGASRVGFRRALARRSSEPA